MIEQMVRCKKWKTCEEKCEHRSKHKEWAFCSFGCEERNGVCKPVKLVKGYERTK